MKETFSETNQFYDFSRSPFSFLSFFNVSLSLICFVCSFLPAPSFPSLLINFVIFTPITSFIPSFFSHLTHSPTLLTFIHAYVSELLRIPLTTLHILFGRRLSTVSCRWWCTEGPQKPRVGAWQECVLTYFSLPLNNTTKYQRRGRDTLSYRREFERFDILVNDTSVLTFRI